MFRFIPLWMPLFIYPLAEKLLLVLLMYPLVDFSLRAALGVLSHIPSGRKTPYLMEKPLADVPFG